MRLLFGICVAMAAPIAIPHAWQGGASPAALSAPRIPPVPQGEWTAEQRAIVAKYGTDGRATNELATLLHHPDLADSLSAVEQYFATQSELPALDREILILRTAWLAQSEHVWSEHLRALPALPRLRPRAVDPARIAGPADAVGWEPFETSLLRAADELHAHSSLSDATWKELGARYNEHQMMDAVFTVAAFTAIATIDNALGVRPERAETTAITVLPPLRAEPVRLREPALKVARVAPLEQADWTPEIRKMLDPTGSGRNVIAVYRTFARHPKLYGPRQLLSEHIRLKNTLTPAQRELLILRMGWLGRSEYEWQQHVRTGRSAGLDTLRITVGPDAPGWTPVEVALLRAADDMYRDDTVSEPVWTELARTFNTQQLMDILATAAGYRMVSTVLNALGVQLEPGGERFP